MEKHYYGVYFIDGCENCHLFDVVSSEDEAGKLLEQYYGNKDTAYDEHYEYWEISEKKAKAFFAEN